MSIRDSQRNNRRSKPAGVPVCMQMESLECGAACLAMVLGFFGRWVPLEQLRLDCGVSRDGANAKNILIAARSYGLEATGYRFDSIEALRGQGTFPCIIHWNFNHFVVLKGFRGNYAYINDPAKGSLRLTAEELDAGFTGVCLMFALTERFVPAGRPRSLLSFVKKRLRQAGSAAVFLMLLSFVTYLIGMISPAFHRFLMDRLLTGENRELLLPFIALFAFVGMLEILVTAMYGIYSLKIAGKLAIVGSSEYVWKVLRMPMDFFSQRQAGDILLRKEASATISKTLVDTFAPLLLNIVMLFLYLVVMIRYSPLLTLVGLIGVAANLGVARIIARLRLNIMRTAMRDAGKLNAATISGISMAETIKASGAESGFFQKWAGYQADVNAAMTKGARVDLYLGALSTLINLLAEGCILVMGVFLCMKGEFTLGSISLFQSYMSLFLAPATTLVESARSFQETRVQMERIEDIMEYPEDELFAAVTAGSATEDEEPAPLAKLRGTIQAEHLFFGYSRLSEPIIKDISFSLKPGERIALVGTSGCGKSTVAKLLGGLFQPWSGTILFDGQPIGAIDQDVFKSSVAVVDQEITLFEDTITDNIKMWDDTIEDFETILAARDAQIHDDITKRQGGYEGRISEGGRDLSGGQRQRLEIARVLAADPTIVILDEATSALDARTEYDLMAAIKDRGVTCIMIAHRLSTIRDCDEILVLEKGEIVERGTHDELYAKNGAYTRLIASD